MSEIDAAPDATNNRPSDTVIVTRLRRFLLGLSAFICLGTLVELFLTEHWQETAQLIPFALSLVGLVALAGMILFPHPNTIMALRVVMIALIAGSVVGMTLHLYNNFAFELDIRPNATIGEVTLDALTGVNPLLAPGILALAALLALAATYHHPALRKSVVP